MIDKTDWQILERLQDGIPLHPCPFEVMAQEIGISEDEFLQRVQKLSECGIIRRIAPRVRHHKVGIEGNIMVVWQVPNEQAQQIGELFASEEAVSHCYTRPTFQGFSYNLYTMIHARDIETAKDIVTRMSQKSGITDYQMLKTVRELKKTSPRYQRPECDIDENR